LLKLRQEGFHEVQGYLLGRPMPLKQAAALIASGASAFAAAAAAAFR
jgi:EAL domain-containing protein (putative c-di-GMP-specific phosphodiesterase class I)